MHLLDGRGEESQFELRPTRRAFSLHCPARLIAIRRSSQALDGDYVPLIGVGEARSEGLKLVSRELRGVLVDENDVTSRLGSACGRSERSDSRSAEGKKRCEPRMPCQRRGGKGVSLKKEGEERERAERGENEPCATPSTSQSSSRRSRPRRRSFRAGRCRPSHLPCPQKP